MDPPTPLPRKCLAKKPVPVPRCLDTNIANTRAGSEQENTNFVKPLSCSENIASVTHTSTNEVDTGPISLISTPSSSIIQNSCDRDITEENDEFVELRSNSRYQFHSMPRQSVILEFDPLLSKDISSDECESETSFETIGSIPSQPPTPPERVDSLSETCNLSAENVAEKTNSNWYTECDQHQEHSRKTPSSLVKRISKVLLGNHSDKEKLCTKPIIKAMQLAPYFGKLKLKGAPRQAVLSDGKLHLYASGPATIVNAKEIYSLSEFCSVQVMSEGSGSDESLELSLISGSSYNKVRLSCAKGERCVWLKHLIGNLSDGFSPVDATKCIRLGWCFVKIGVSSPWQGAWLMLKEQTLLYYIPSTEHATPVLLDLRKLKNLTSRQVEDEAAIIQEFPTPRSDRYHILSFPNQILYLLAPKKQECKLWSELILLRRQSGSSLHQQHLTGNDVPVIVHKCIDFIYAYGSFSEGIYRKAGLTSVVVNLLEDFRKDAHSVYLNKEHCSEHEVAAVLRRFLRDLPDPLIDVREALCGARQITNRENRFIAYREALSRMNNIRRATIQLLFSHLNFIDAAHEKNRMSAQNLAAVWTQTLMPSQKNGEWGAVECEVIRELIRDYKEIWQVSETAEERESKMRQALMMHENKMLAPHKQAGDLKIWIYVGKYGAEYQHSVLLSPNKTCSEVCEEMSAHTVFPPHRLVIEEVIIDESLHRFIIGSECPFQSVALWPFYQEKYRKNNYLIVRDDTYLRLMETVRDDVLDGVSGKLKYASPKMKHFKTCFFSLKSGVLTRYNSEKENEKSIGDRWVVNELVWYSGTESGRLEPSPSWSITFVHKTSNLSKSSDTDNMYFGHTICGEEGDEEELQWNAALTYAQHKNILTEPKLVSI